MLVPTVLACAAFQRANAPSQAEVRCSDSATESLVVTLSDREGDLLPGGLVVVETVEGNEVAQAKTNNDGVATFALSAGTYSVRTILPGFLDVRHRVVLPVGSKCEARLVTSLDLKYVVQ